MSRKHAKRARMVPIKAGDRAAWAPAV